MTRMRWPYLLKLIRASETRLSWNSGGARYPLATYSLWLNVRLLWPSSCFRRTASTSSLAAGAMRCRASKQEQSRKAAGSDRIIMAPPPLRPLAQRVICFGGRLKDEFLHVKLTCVEKKDVS